MTLARLALIATLALSGFAPGTGQAQQLANRLFGAKTTASAHQPHAVGSYSKGCGAGMMQLPETGPTWQAMRLSRNRNWGNPQMIAYIQRLSAVAARQPGWDGLYVGDISQPRGGPMTSGHASHQVGLDADIWMLPPRSLRLSRAQRENISSINVRAASQRSVNGNWTPQHAAILEAAARDDAVDRIFVTPPVKVAMCNSASRGDGRWLQKIRPWYGHNYHFHVRLKCPRGDGTCITQTPTVAELSKGGSGCDDTLAWWVTDRLDPPKATKPSKPSKPRPRKKGPREFTMADLPQQCRNVLLSR